ncbi:MAG: glycosyltransferase family 2 protein [Mariniblastus sp.]
MPLETPIAFCIFNRPELTAKVFARIRDVKPKRLFVIADGARPEKQGEADLVKQTRAVIELVDWDCEVKTDFANQNLGCKKRISTGLDWAFGQSEELIILEDDCLPAKSFFPFCEELLNRYRDQPKIMMISGNNFQPESLSEDSYYFSRWPHIWGWASWRRAWKHFDAEVSSWPNSKSSGDLRSVFGSAEEYDYWSTMLDQQHAGAIDTWDFPWAYACWQNKGLSILPQRNLVTNLGFGPSATHTTDVNSMLANLKSNEMGKLTHPSKIHPNVVADQYTWANVMSPKVAADSNPSPPRNPKWYHRFTRSKAG